MYDLLSCKGVVTKIALKVSKYDNQSKIKQVYTGSVPELVVIVLKQSRQDMCSIIWNIEQNTEVECFDHSQDSAVFWGFVGDSYILCKDKIYNSEMGLCFK